jgi:hypothetical protein
MSTPEKGYNINQTFIIETNEDGGVLSACTALFTTNIYSCSGNTQILMGNTSINMVGDVFVNGDLSATTISATTYYGDGSNLTGITTKDTFVTGGTYNNGTAVFKNNTGGTFSVSGFSTGYTLTSSAITSTLGYVPLSSYTDTFVTGGTYSNEIIIFTNNTGGTFSVSGFSTSNTTEFTGGSVSGKTVFTNGLTANTISATTYQNLPLDIHVTGFSFNNGNYNITINQNDGTSYTQNLSILATDVNITGGTYNPVTGVATFINNTGGTFNVSGFLTGYTDTTISAFTYNNANTFKIDSNNGDSFSATIDYVTGLTANTLSATTYLGLPLDIRVTGATYSNNTFTFSNNTGGTFNVLFNTVSGLTATTISATTYQNLPTDVRVTGGTYSNGTAIFTNNTGGTFSVSGFSTGSGSGSDIFVTGATYNNANQFTFTNNTGGTFNVSFNTVSGLTATTISATTYQNLPTDVFVTGGTYSSGTAIFTNNTGGTFSVSGFSSSSSNSSFTGGTVSGSTNFTNGLSATTIYATTYDNLPTDIRVTGGTYTNGTLTFTNNIGSTFNITGLSTGGGGGQLFYLNISQSKNGDRYLSTDASTASQQSTGVTINNGATATIASFQSDVLGMTLIPGGIWSFYLHSNKDTNNASFEIFVEVYKRTSGGTQTLLFTTDSEPVLATSPNINMQICDAYFSGSPITLTDSIVAVVRATNTRNQSHTITLFSEGNQHYSYAISTLPAQQGLTCDTLSGCSIIQTIQSNLNNKLDKSGGTITNNLIVNGNLSATTISASTYQNLPIDIRVTGGTYSSGTAIFTNNTGGTFSVSGFSTGSGSGSSSSIVVGSTVISSGTTGRIPFNNSGLYGESANFFWDNSNSRLGLGGIAPNYNFSIMRNAPNTFVGMQISNNSSGTAGSDGLLIGIGSDNNARVETQDANSIIISSNSTGRLQVGTSGTQFFGTLSNLSVGSINTGAIFQVNGNSSTSGLGFFQLRNNGGTPVLCANENGKVFINLNSVGTAQFHIGAGSTAANTAPIKINSGPLMATPESGTIEYNNTFHVTNSDSTRRHIVTAPNTTKVTAGAPYTNDGYIIVNIGGTDFKLMTTA